MGASAGVRAQSLPSAIRSLFCDASHKTPAKAPQPGRTKSGNDSMNHTIGRMSTLLLRGTGAPFDRDRAALWLRIGLGLVFVIGGWSKLGQLFAADGGIAMVSSYMGPGGYVNTFFTDYLFRGTLAGLISPWQFLAALSAFELASGLALLAGFLVRPFALVYGFLLWTFVFSLPVVTTPGVVAAVDTYTSPALLVQARDVCLSGLMFVLFNLGPGRPAVDRPLPPELGSGDWNSLGLLARLSLALPLLVGGFFVGFDSIQDFSTYAPVLIVLGVLLVAGVGVRQSAIVVAVVMLWYALGKFSSDKSLIANLNGFKREFALTAVALLLARFGGGSRFVWHLPRMGARAASGGVPGGSTGGGVRRAGARQADDAEVTLTPQ